MWRLKSKPCWLPSMMTSLLISDNVMSQQNKILEIRKGLWFWWHPNEYLWYLPRRPLVNLTHLLNYCLQLGHFSAPWKEEKTTETAQRSKISPKLMYYQPLVHYRQTIWEADFKNNPKTPRGKKFTKYKCLAFGQITVRHFNVMRLADHVTLNFNSCCVLGYQGSLRHGMALWTTI
jgi:hypothetical protein